MTKSSKRRRGPVKPQPAEGEKSKGRRQKAITKAATVSPLPVKISVVGKSGARASGHLVESRADDERNSMKATRRVQVMDSPDPTGREAATAVLESLAQWRDEMGKAVKTITAEPAKSGAHQLAALLGGQRQVLEQVKASLTQMQRMIEASEAELKQPGGTGASTGMALPPPVAALVPTSAAVVQAPIEASMAPVTAIWSMQKAAVSNFGVWAKAAQDYQGMWFGAMQSMVPGMGAANRSVNGAEKPRDEVAERRQEKRDRG